MSVGADSLSGLSGYHPGNGEQEREESKCKKFHNLSIETHFQ